ncbi:MAG: hypothetical protein BroJett011_41910 [Chloroflexota bacterium]|nr:MAG: hypothetical protein BroJett011_41910 [Chloroflexota bacterium]
MLELGRLIDRLVRSLNARSDLTMTATHVELGQRLGFAPDTIHRWRSGRNKPSSETLAQLVKIGVAEAGLDRAWAERVLFLGEHLERLALLDQLFGQAASGVRHNLPQRPFIRLVGREREVAQIIERLAPEARHWLAPIEGVGGVGKSALALEVGWRIVEGYLQLPAGRRFDAVIWVSAKREALTAQGIETQRQGFTNLDDIFRAIADVLEWPGILRVSDDRRPAEVDRALRDSHVLLILDNLETVEDPHVLRFLRDLPPPTKAIVTMRFHEDMPYPIRLVELGREAATELALQECEARGITLDDEAMSRLLTYTRGIPLAIWWAVGLLAMEGYTIEATLDRLADPADDLQRFIFGETLARLRLRWPEALEVLLVLTFFDSDSGATTKALAATTGLALSAVEQAQQRLLNLNLISRHQSGGRFTMLPLTRDFAQQELTPEWEAAARERWSDFFVEYLELYGDDDFGESIAYREELRAEIKNLRLAIDWCFEHCLHKAVRLVERITTFLLDEGEWPERLELCRRALAVARTPASRAGLLTRLGWSYYEQGDDERARKAQDEGIEIARQYNLHERLVQLLHDSGRWYSEQGDYSQADRLYAEALELATSMDYEFRIIEAEYFRARGAYLKGDYQTAKQGFLELLRRGVKQFHPRQALAVLRLLGEIAIAEKQYDEARNYLEDFKSVSKLYYEADEKAEFYQNWGDLERATGHLDKAREAYEKALHLCTRLGMRKEVGWLEAKLQEIKPQDNENN